MLTVQAPQIKLFPIDKHNIEQVQQQVNEYSIQHRRMFGNGVSVELTSTYICVHGSQPVSYDDDRSLATILEAQRQLIEVLEQQVSDLSMMSKIELGDDVIARIRELRKQTLP